MEDKILCYLCYEEESEVNPYLKEPPPCECKGSIVIHNNCLQEVLKTSRVCTICKTKYKLHYLPSRNGLELVSEVAINGDITEYTIDMSGDIQGEHIVKKQTGELISQCHYKDNLLDGEYKTWYADGQLECICTCVRNKIHGLYQAWYNNGTMMEETLYKEGVKHGLCKRWDKEGNLIITRRYINGELPLPDEFDSN